MPVTKLRDSRRKLLKSVVVGSGAVAAGKSLPESWIKPAMNSVLLPAHAMTTEIDDSTGNVTTEVTKATPVIVCKPLFISRDSVSCHDIGNLRRFRYFYVDDTGKCPALVSVGYADQAPGSAEVLKSAVSVSDTMDAYFGTRGDSLQRVSQACGANTNETQLIQIRMQFTAMSGAQWIATGRLRKETTGVSVSDISLVPSL